MADIGIIKFQLADLQFGMFADNILEIVRLTDFRKISRPLPYVIGITELRHYIVVIIDLRKRFGLSPIPLGEGTTMIITKSSSGMIGLLVESISHFKRVPEEKILPPISIAGFPARLLRGELADEEDILIIPDFDKIFSSYIRIQLFPITSSEKIAFRYRSTPGSITRTLEKTLIGRESLDESIIRKLPRSISLSSAQVHKIISYYPKFQPKQQASKNQKQSFAPSQDIKAGDEKYLSLPEQLPSQHRQKVYEQTVQQSELTASLQAFFLSDSGKRGTRILEKLLHESEEVDETGRGKLSVSPQTLIAHKELGREAAKTLHIPSVQLIKYLTYYPQQIGFKQCSERENPDEQNTSSPQKPAPSLEERLEELRRSHLPVEEVLHVVNDEHYVLARKHIRWLQAHYRISLLRLAKLIQLFPELQVILRREDEKVEEEQNAEKKHEVDARNDEQEQSQGDYAFLRSQMSQSKYSGDVTRCFHILSERELLADDAAVRYVAEQLHVATCRLSKLRSYYRMK